MEYALKSAFTLSDEGVGSPSGAWVLRYGDDGCAAVIGPDGTRTWVAGGEQPVPGRLRLENSNRLTVYEGDQVLWDSGRLLDAPYPEVITELWVTDEGDAVLVDLRGVPRVSLLTGLLETTNLGPQASISAITGSQYLCSEDGKRVVTRSWAGGLRCWEELGRGAAMVNEYPAESAQRLDQDGAQLTWRLIGEPGRERWRLVLVEERVIWTDGDPIHLLPATASSAAAEVSTGSGPSYGLPSIPGSTPTRAATPGRVARPARPGSPARVANRAHPGVPKRPAVKAVSAGRPRIDPSDYDLAWFPLVLFRTDPSDDSAWAEILDELAETEYGPVHLHPISAPGWEGATVEEILAAMPPRNQSPSAVFVADATTMRTSGRPLLAVSTRIEDESAREVRIEAGSVALIHSNLAIANIGFNELVNRASSEADGVIRD